jgi:hypothetical protein
MPAVVLSALFEAMREGDEQSVVHCCEEEERDYELEAWVSGCK